MDLKKVSVRAGSGLVYIALVTGLICCGYPGAILLASLFTILATIEFDRISVAPQRKRVAVIICDVLLNLSVSLILVTPSLSPVFITLFITLLFIRYILELHGKEENPFRSLSTSLMSIIYIGVPMLCMNVIAEWTAIWMSPFTDSCNPLVNVTPLWPLLGVFVLIWINDTGAFLTGSLIGRHKLSPEISPKKTWEGFFGGMLLTTAGAVTGGEMLMKELAIPFWAWIVFGMALSGFATWGDLTESQIKRNLGLKDSGHIMPGHGGILDRIDSLLFVMPMTLILMHIYRIVYVQGCGVL